jgi:hypothetical protein
LGKAGGVQFGGVGVFGEAGVRVTTDSFDEVTGCSYNLSHEI